MEQVEFPRSPSHQPCWSQRLAHREGLTATRSLGITSSRMTRVMSLDIETSNYSYDIGGWENTHMFDPTVVATYDGEDSTIFCNQDIDMDADVRPLHPRDVGDHIMAHIKAGGALVGHNILRFDLPVLRDALDCHAAGEILRKHKDNVIDTSQHLRKSTTLVGNQFFITS